MDLRNQEMNDRMVQFFMSQGLSMEQARLAAQIELEKQKRQAYEAAMAINAGISSENAAQRMGLLGAGSNMIGGIIQAIRGGK